MRYCYLATNFEAAGIKHTVHDLDDGVRRWLRDIIVLGDLQADGEFHAELADRDDVVAWLREVPWPGEMAEFIHASLDGMVRASYNAFCAHFDDIWYPSADDLFVVSDKTVLLLDHDEYFRFWRFVSEQPAGVLAPNK